MCGNCNFVGSDSGYIFGLHTYVHNNSSAAVTKMHENWTFLVQFLVDTNLKIFR